MVKKQEQRGEADKEKVSKVMIRDVHQYDDGYEMFCFLEGLDHYSGNDTLKKMCELVHKRSQKIQPLHDKEVSND